MDRWLFACSLWMTAAALLPAQRGTTLGGRVLDENGQPLAGVAVCLVADAGRFVTAELVREPLAQTDARGDYAAALPPGVVEQACSLLFVGKDRVHVLAPLRAHDGWPVVLPKGCMLVGRVVDPAGKPLADVRVEARDGLRQMRWLAPGVNLEWLPEPRTAVRTDDAGMFRMPGSCQAGVRLVVGDGRGQLGGMPVALGDPIELVYDPAPAAAGGAVVPNARPPAPTVLVRAVDPDGRPLREFRCAAVRTDDATYGPALRQRLERHAVVGRDGEARSTIAGERQGRVVVVADADGMATACLALDEGATEVTVPFVREATLAGTVVDATGAPVAGARLWVIHGPPKGHFEVLWWGGDRVADFDPGSGHAVSDAHGAFVVHHVRADEQYLACVAPGCDVPLPLVVAPVAGAAVGGLRVAVVRHPAIAGTTGLARLPMAAASVRFVGEGALARDGLGLFARDADARSGGVPIDAEGSFRVAALAPGKYTAQWVIPRPLRHGAPDVLDVQVVDVAAQTTSLALDLRPLVPARVRGKVRGPMPWSRLLVGVSCRRGPQKAFTMYAAYEGPFTFVTPDGSFQLSTPPGDCTVYVLDAWTGVLLHREAPRGIAAGAEVHVACEIVAAPLDVRVVGHDGSAAWLEVVLPASVLPNGIDTMQHMERLVGPYSTNLGCLVGPATASLRLWLPPVAGELVLVSCQDRDLRQELARAPFDVAVGAARTVTLTLPR